MSVVKIEWGTKRCCQGCSARFYDLSRTPIVCPKCGETYEVQSLTRSRRNRAAAAEEKVVPLDDLAIVDNLELPEDLDSELAPDEDLLEDTEDLDETLEDIPDVLTDDGEDH